jgi:hypothetical protein
MASPTPDKSYDPADASRRGTSMRKAIVLVLGLFASASAFAQPVYRFDEVLAADRPEAWAMHYLASAALPTGFGATPDLAAGQWRLAAELAHIPRLDEAQRTVGLEGTKLEDLNKSPVFGRLRVDVGLPAKWRLEAGWTPPVTIGGARADALFALAIGRRFDVGERVSLHARVFGQHGRIGGDFTCPAELANEPDPELNPYGCEAASHDRFALRQYGAELDAAFGRGRWQALAGVGAVRNETQVQLDALTFGVNDRSRLVANHWRAFVSVGVRGQLSPQWDVAAQWLHVPLQVRRDPGGEREHDDFGGVRLQLAWRPR